MREVTFRIGADEDECAVYADGVHLGSVGGEWGTMTLSEAMFNIGEWASSFARYAQDPQPPSLAVQRIDDHNLVVFRPPAGGFRVVCQFGNSEMWVHISPNGVRRSDRTHRLWFTYGELCTVSLWHLIEGSPQPRNTPPIYTFTGDGSSQQTDYDTCVHLARGWVLRHDPDASRLLIRVQEGEWYEHRLINGRWLVTDEPRDLAELQ